MADYDAEYWYDLAESLRREADERLDALQDYIDDEEHEINDMHREADQAIEKAKELEDAED